MEPTITWRQDEDGTFSIWTDGFCYEKGIHSLAFVRTSMLGRIAGETRRAAELEVELDEARTSVADWKDGLKRLNAHLFEEADDA